MFPAGLEPDRIARLQALVTQCRPVLLGGDAAAYRATKRIVPLHPSRVDLLDWHKDLMSTVDDLNQGA